VAEAYGVWGEKSLYGRKYMGIVRSAFVVDAKGKLAGVFPKISPKDTVPKVTKILESLQD
jgi:peroxiredoxin Q/BCP